MKLIQIVHQLRQAQGSNAKLKILKKHKDNDMWKLFLQYTYDTTITYGVSSPTTMDFNEEEITIELFRSFDNLATRRITGNDAKKLVNNLSTVFGEIPRLILGRSIKAGVSTGLINKAYPGLIKLFETMKGMDVPITQYPVISSIKYDGVKVFAFVRPNSITLKTSSGASFPLKSLTNDLINRPYGVYEGELIHNLGRQVDRPTISGKLSSLLKGTKVDIDDYTFVIYDWIPLEEWDLQEGTTSYVDRYAGLITAIDRDFKYLTSIVPVKFDTEEDIINYTNNLIDMGYEGSMSRYPEDPYMWTGNKRTPRLIKKKAIKECVLKCIDYTRHSNPSKGLTGSLLCRGLVDNKEIVVNVGSGMSKDDINIEGEWYVGKDIEIIYNTLIESDGKYSLFLPRFKRVVASY